MLQANLPAIGPLIIDILGTTLSTEDSTVLAHQAVGGIVLFSRNYRNRAELINLCQAIRCARATPLLIMVDQEGGRVQRFKHEFTLLPPLASLGKWFDKNKKAALEISKNAGWLMASELLAVGIDLSLAPVLDLDKQLSSVIGDRAFHRDALIVTQLANSYMQGMAEAGMAATGKHFPGHGTVVPDSHVALPSDERELAAILADDLIPFKALIAANIPAMMAAHIVYPKIDHHPVSFSAKWLKQILRKQLGFNGVIFSDDLSMEGAAISPHVGMRAEQALTAGCDFALICNNRAGVLQTLTTFENHLPFVAPEKWMRLRGNFTIGKHYRETKRWQQIQHNLRMET